MQRNLEVGKGVKINWKVKPRLSRPWQYGNSFKPALRQIYDYLSRSSPPEVFLWKDVLEICSRFTGEHPCRRVISTKLISNFIEVNIRTNFIQHFPYRLIFHFDPLSANPTKWPNTLKQFVGNSRRVCFTILWGWRLKG